MMARPAAPSDLAGIEGVYRRCLGPAAAGAARRVGDEMDSGRQHVVEASDGRLCGAFSFEPVSSDGRLSGYAAPGTYGTVGRIVSDNAASLSARTALRYAQGRCARLLVEAPASNRRMGRLLACSGFAELGPSRAGAAVVYGWPAASFVAAACGKEA